MKINPRQMEKLMRQMGIQAKPVEALEVIIKTPDKEIVITNPQVSRVNAMGQDTFQIMGEVSERSSGPSEEDIATVAGQSGVSKDQARKALEETSGDLAAAIIKLEQKKFTS